MVDKVGKKLPSDVEAFMRELVKEVLSEKVKGSDGKACWKGYRYVGTKDGKDICVKITK
jgi:hypothetical protein